MQGYSNPRRANDRYALPDVEVFHHNGESLTDDEGDYLSEGWYWWTCLPECLPDSDPIGPFDTYAEALADAQEGCDDDEDEEDLDPILSTHALPDNFNIGYARACKWSCARCGMSVTDAMANVCKVQA